MGAEANCRATAGDESADGKALLETNELIFRSPGLRLKIQLGSIRKVAANDGVLRITYDGGDATFELGPRAAAWADKIRNPKPLLDKLGVKPEHRVVALNVRDGDFLARLRVRTPHIATRLHKQADVIFLQGETLDAFARLNVLRESIKRAGMIWTIAPKGKDGIKDTDIMAAGRAAGLVDVKVASFSPTHSATKFVIPKAER